MSELKELLEKVKLENIMAFMIYGADSRRDAFENYEKEIEKLVSSLKEKIFELKNPELVEKRKEEKTSMRERIVSAKTKAKERNEKTKEKPRFSIEELQKNKKEIERKQKLSKKKTRKGGRSR